jgi:hypothetical protein
VAAAATCRGGLGPLSRLAKTHSRSSTVLVDEFDARHFKGAPNDILSSPARLTAVSFELVDSHHSHAGAIGQHLLAPAEKAPCRPALCRCDHHPSSQKQINFTIIKIIIDDS